MPLFFKNATISEIKNSRCSPGRVLCGVVGESLGGICRRHPLGRPAMSAFARLKRHVLGLTRAGVADPDPVRARHTASPLWPVRRIFFSEICTGRGGRSRWNRAKYSGTADSGLMNTGSARRRSYADWVAGTHSTSPQWYLRVLRSMCLLVSRLLRTSDASGNAVQGRGRDVASGANGEAVVSAVELKARPSPHIYRPVVRMTAVGLRILTRIAVGIGRAPTRVWSCAICADGWRARDRGCFKGSGP